MAVLRYVALVPKRLYMYVKMETTVNLDPKCKDTPVNILCLSKRRLFVNRL